MDEITKRLLESLLSGGVPGSILIYILYKIAPAVSQFRDNLTTALRNLERSNTDALRKLEEAVHRRAVVDLMRLAVDPSVSDRMKDAARELVKEIGDAEEARKKEIERAATPAPPAA